MGGKWVEEVTERECGKTEKKNKRERERNGWKGG